MALETPMLKIRCDGCENEDEVEVAYMYHGYSERTGFYDIETTLDNLREAGWEIPHAPDTDGRIEMCPDCNDKTECGGCGEKYPADELNDEGFCYDCQDFCKICGDVAVTVAQDWTCDSCRAKVNA